jgi:hypothetical protein
LVSLAPVGQTVSNAARKAVIIDAGGIPLEGDGKDLLTETRTCISQRSIQFQHGSAFRTSSYQLKETEDTHIVDIKKMPIF